MTKKIRWMAIGAVAMVFTLVSPCNAERIEVPLSTGTVVTNPTQGTVERGFIGNPLPKILDSVYLDVAELVLAVSTVYDTTEPLIIAAFPATVSPEAWSATWSAEWTPMTGGFTTENGGLASMLDTRSGTEIRIDVTAMVRRWLAGEIPNYGVVLKSLSEDARSTFGWVRDSRYDGADAKLVIHYSRLYR